MLFRSLLKELGIKIAVVTSRPTIEALYTLKNVNGLLDKFIESEHFIISAGRSEERRVGKECRSRW